MAAVDDDLDLEGMLGFDDNGVRALLGRFTGEVARAWKRGAPSADYRRAVSGKVVDDGPAGEVKLKGPSVFVELGRKPRDLKLALLASPKAKFSARVGRYIAVPLGRQGEKRIVIASEQGKPWMTKGKPGVGVLKTVKTSLSQLFLRAREAWFGDA